MTRVRYTLYAVVLVVFVCLSTFSLYARALSGGAKNGESEVSHTPRSLLSLDSPSSTQLSPLYPYALWREGEREEWLSERDVIKPDTNIEDVVALTSEKKREEREAWADQRKAHYEVLRHRNPTPPELDLRSHDNDEVGKSFKNKKVFIYSMPRSGSTFTGGVFKNIPDMIYLFEPFRNLGWEEGCAANNETLNSRHAKDLISEVYSCNHKNLYAFQNKDWWVRSSPLVDRRSCQAGTPPSKMVVIKEINSFWGYNIDYLKNVVGDGLRFIWLVRDPRGWTSSWLYDSGSKDGNFYKVWEYDIMDMYDVYFGSCKTRTDLPGEVSELLEMYRPYLSSSQYEPHVRMAAWWTIETLVQYHMINKFLPNDYYLLKYEEMSADPTAAATNMYKFIGINSLPESTSRYLRVNTKGGSQTNRYGTTRNSQQMLDVWSKRLSECQIRQIEWISKPAFNLMGYTSHFPQTTIDSPMGERCETHTPHTSPQMA